MENVFDAGKIPYVAAPPLVPWTMWKKISFTFYLLCDISMILVMSIPNWLDALYRLFISRRMKSVRGQVALITGGGNGIGKAIAFELARHGCKIAIVDIDHQAAMTTANAVKKMHVVDVRGYCADISDYVAMCTLRTQIESDIGPIDILINNAALMPLLSFREGTEEEIERIIQVNITANIFTTRIFLPGMLKRRQGHIVQLSSMSAMHPMPGAVIYTATKYAVKGYVEALAHELRQEGYEDCVRFTSTHPYFVSTRKDMMDALSLRFPALTAEETAAVIVTAMLRNEYIVSVPRADRFLAALVGSMPLKNQNLVRDYVLREKQSNIRKYPNK